MRNFFLISIFLFSTYTFADDYSENSPIGWSVIVDNAGKSEVYTGSKFDAFLKKGLSNKDLKLKCSFKFEKGISDKIKVDKKLTVGGEYNERLWVDCLLGDVSVSINAISCTDSKTGWNDSESQGLFFNLNQASLTFSCMVKNLK